ncbi:hypothetical protein [Desulfobacula sp.]
MDTDPPSRYHLADGQGWSTTHGSEGKRKFDGGFGWMGHIDK